MVRCYRKKNFNVYSGDDDTYIIHNMSKKFEDGHTHVRNFKTCKYIIDLSIHKSIPRNSPPRVIESLIRIADDDNYIQRLKKFRNNKKKKLRYNNKQ